MSRYKIICEGCGKEKTVNENRKLCAVCREVAAYLKSGKIRPPDFPDVNTRAYKEPMQKVKKGYGYYGAITQTNDGKHIQCHICGFYYSRLGGHITNKHKENIREYKIKYGLRISEGLLSPIAKIEAQATYNKHNRKTREEFTAMSHKARKKRIRIVHKGWTAQTRNEKGRCRDQTIAKLQALAKKNGGVVLQSMVDSAYGTGMMDTVEHWFKTWDNALKVAGVKSFAKSRVEQREKRKEAAIEAIQTFYQQYERTPQSADLDGNPNLPNTDSVQQLFGTVNKARLEAGVPLLVYFGNGRRWEEVPLGEEEEWMFAGRPIQSRASQ